MKKIIIAAIFMATTGIYAQVGVGNTDPKATLDVTGDAATATVVDGIIAPRLTGDQLAAKDAVYVAAQTGTQVYVTAAATTPAGKTINVNAPGYYFYDGAAWQKFVSKPGKFVDGTLVTDAVYTAGNVGIGTIAPDRKLVVSQAGNGSAIVNVASPNLNRFESTANSSSTGLSLVAKDATGVDKSVAIGMNPDALGGVFAMTDAAGFQFLLYKTVDNHLSLGHNSGNVGIGTVTPVPSAVLDVTSTTKGFLPPRMTKVQMDAIVTPAEGLIVYCTNCFPKGVFVNNGSTFVSMVNNTPNVPAGVTLAADEVYSTTGKIWKGRNLGASQVATSSTDFNGYGNFYQWGRANDGHQVIVHTAATLLNGTAPAAGSSSSAAGPVPAGTEGANFITNAITPFDWLTVQDDTRWQTAAGVNNPCPSGFRIPTETELNNERLAFTSNNAAGAYASLLKLPVAGSRYFSDGTLHSVGSFGAYWSSTVSGTNARRLDFGSSTASMRSNNRASGFSVRCIKD